MNQRRSVLLAMLLALLLPLLAACGTGNQNTGSNATSAPAGNATSAAGVNATSAPAADGQFFAVEDGAVLRVSTWGDTGEIQINEESFARFNQIYPNVTIQYEPIPADFETKMKADMAAQTNPDVFYLNSSLMASFAPEGLLLDLAPYLQEAGIGADSFAPALQELFTSEGKIYGIAKDFGPLVLFINNRMAEEAGIDPASIKTWDDWRAAAETLTQGEGNSKVYGQCSAADANRFGALMLQNGVAPVADGQVQITDPRALEAVQFWYGMYNDGFAQIPAELGSGWCGEAFGQEKVAMALEGGWMVPYLANDYADLAYTAVPLPTPGSGGTGTLLFTNAWSAAANTQYPRAAAALILYLTSVENQQPILESGFALPTNTGLADVEFLRENPNVQVLFDAANYGTVADLAFGGLAVKEDVIKALNTNAEAAWLGQTDLETAMQTAQQEAEAVVQP